MNSGTENIKTSEMALRDILIGISEGLTVPFAFAAALSVVATTPSTILISCALVIIAGAVTMGIGGYFTALELSNDEEEEAKAHMNFDPEDQLQVNAEVEKDRLKWREMAATYFSNAETNTTAWKSAVFIALSYIFGGLIPVSVFYFISEPQVALKYSAVITLTILFVVGYSKNKLAGENPWAGGLRLMLTGAIAAAAAFCVALIFRGN